MARPVHPYFVPSTAQAPDTRNARRDASSRDYSRTLAGMLLAAVVAALLVVADQLIDTWADGHLLVVWVALWSVAFAALAVLAPPLRQLADRSAAWLTRWSQVRAQHRSDAAIWQIAQQDHRLMQELHVARLHAESET